MIQGDAERLREEVERLRRERDRLQAEVEGRHRGMSRRSRIRSGATAVAVVASVLAFAAAVPGTWTRRTVLNTDRYVALSSEIAARPAVQERLAVRITDATFEALDVEARLEVVLADVRNELAFLAGPITQAVRDRVNARVEQLIASDMFQELWTDANRVAHTEILAVLRDASETLQLVDDRVVLNTLPIVNAALEGLTGFASELVGRPVDLPEITAETVPAEAIRGLETALGVDLPDDLGAIGIYDAAEVDGVQRALNTADRGVVLLVILWLVALLVALAVSRRRRRTLLQLMIASAVVLALERRFAIAIVDGIVDGLDPDARAAGLAIADVLLGNLLRYTGWLLALLLSVVVLALVTGPYAWAVRLRQAVVELVAAAAGIVRGRQVSPTARWIAQRRDPLMLAGIAVSIVVLLFVDLGIVGLLVLASLLALYELAIWRSGGVLTPAAPG